MSQQSSNLKSRVTVLAAEAASERALRAEASIKASPAEVWRAWTTSDGAQTFFAPKANIQLDVGGPYEIYFNPANERMSTKGMKVLSFAPEQRISFQWNAPGDVANMPGDGTWVVVELRPEGAGATHVTLSHLGWKSAADLDHAFAHFSQGWAEALQRLNRRFADGPIDWQAEAMMWKERQKSATAP
jgi:uncharacterized protein YndB with AHSA1/START domain